MPCPAVPAPLPPLPPLSKPRCCADLLREETAAHLSMHAIRAGSGAGGETRRGSDAASRGGAAYAVAPGVPFACSLHSPFSCPPSALISRPPPRAERRRSYLPHVPARLKCAPWRRRWQRSERGTQRSVRGRRAARPPARPCPPFEVRCACVFRGPAVRDAGGYTVQGRYRVGSLVPGAGGGRWVGTRVPGAADGLRMEKLKSGR